MDKSKPRVLIIGAGLGGLALAQALRKQHVPFQIFERDIGPETRSQGWAVSLHWILKDLLSSTLRDVHSLERCSVTHELGISAEFSLFDAHSGKQLGNVVGRSPDGDLTMIRVNRARYRDWLLKHLEINWNKRFSYYEEFEDGVKAFFDDGTVAIGEIIVGADGINSYVRGHMLRANPPQLNRIPLGLVMGQVSLPKSQYEQQLAISPSFYFCYGKGFGLFNGLMEISKDKSTADYYWMLSWKDPKAMDPVRYWTSIASQKEMLDFAVEKVKGMDRRLSELVRMTKPEGILLPPIQVRDLVPTKMPLGRVTLLGDAVHPMTFFRGEGANHAMQDGLNLARAISQAAANSEGMGAGARLDVPKTLKLYEEEMLERSKAAVLSSREAATVLEFRPGLIPGVELATDVKVVD
ncbi:MAG: hypothetical protein Q9187_002520 [Circinaria calcarea]